MKHKFIINPIALEIESILNHLDLLREMYRLPERYNPNNDEALNFTKYKTISNKLEEILDMIIVARESIDKSGDEKIESIYKLLVNKKIHLSIIISHLNLASTRLYLAERNIRKMIATINHALKKRDLSSKYKFFYKLIFRFVKAKKNLKIVLTSIYEIRKVIDAQIILKNGLKDYVISNKALQKGDVLLFYDAQSFLDDNILARLIAIAQHSRITHSGVICETSRNKVSYLSAAATGARVDIFDLRVAPGRYLFVLRPNINKEKELYYMKELDLLSYKIKNMTQYYGFAELKSWTAVFIGLFRMILVTRLHLNLYIKNPFTNKSKFFCSELVDDMFTNLGIYLTSGSGATATIGPAEMFFSPRLDFIGVLCNKNELKNLEKEDLVF